MPRCEKPALRPATRVIRPCGKRADAAWLELLRVLVATGADFGIGHQPSDGHSDRALQMQALHHSWYDAQGSLPAGYAAILMSLAFSMSAAPC
jgi:hypothetical protein